MFERTQEYDRMARAESDLWWYRCLHFLTLDAIRRHGCAPDAAILDAGCGTGGLLRHLAGHGFTNLCGFDASPHAVALAREKGARVELMTLEGAAQQFSPGSFDVICCNDVLYFFGFEAQLETIRTLRSLLRPGGLLIINAPRSRRYAGTHDLAVSIRSRLSEQEIQRLLNLPGFNPVRCVRWPGTLAPVILAVRAIQRRRARHAPNAAESDVKPIGRLANLCCYWITRLELALFRRGFAGSSIFIALRAMPLNMQPAAGKDRVDGPGRIAEATPEACLVGRD